MSTYFISDLHLSEQQPHLTDLFIHFLECYAINAKALYILGDFFDVWIGDDNLTEFNQKTFQLLKTITDKNIPVYFMSGNRDFMLGKQFLQMTGCQLLAEPTVINLYGENILLMHGDSLCTDDKWHILFRKLSRHRFTKTLFLLFPLAWRRAIANRLRTISKNKNHHTSAAILDAVPAAIKQQFIMFSVQHLIHGHTHKPSIHWFYNNNAWHEHIVLSDWGQRGNFLICHADGRKELRYFQ